MSGAGIIDAAARLRALDPAGSFVVQAPAGSGKTELLTRRLLRLLAAVNEPEEIVAITFTRKAAAEMRARVHQAIRLAAAGTPAADPHAAQTLALSKAAMARSRERGWQLEASPHRLRVMTIDALCATIVQQSPLLSRSGGNPNVVEDAEPLYREAARETLSLIDDERYAAPVRRTLLHYDNQVRALEEQLIGLLARRDQWLSLTFDATDAAAQRQSLEAVLRAQIEHALAKLATALPDDLRRQWRALAADAAMNLRASQPDHPLHPIPAEPGFDAADLPHWQAMIPLVLTQSDQWRRSWNRDTGIAGELRGHAQGLVESLRGVPDLELLLARIRCLPVAQFSESQWQILQDLLACMKLAAAQLQLVFAARGIVDFTEVAQQAVTALGEESAPSDLALRLDYRIRHLLVDEFQDTSALQWRLLERLTAGWQPDDGRTLFLVGDPMQSIYRFREAEVGLFLRAQRESIGAIQLSTLQLSANFRARPELVAWCNTVFPQVLPSTAEIALGAVPYTPAIAARQAGEPGAVIVHAGIERSHEQEAAEILSLLTGLRAADSTASIAILARARSHVSDLAVQLRVAGIAYQAIEIETLEERPVVADLRALTRALCHPADRLAWLAVLRAPWCGLTLADLRELAQTEGATLLPSLRDAAQRLSEDGRLRLGRVLPVIESSLAQRGRKPLRRWIEDTWIALGGPACVNSSADLVDARNFFRVLERVAAGSELSGLHALDHALAEVRATASAEPTASVQLMTIHRAKGLEFDHVIVPGLGRPPRRGDRPSLLWTTLPRTDDGGELAFLMAPVAAAGGEADPVYELVRELETEKQYYEDGRLLYVAATRARQQLHVFGSVAAGDDGPAAPPGDSLLRRLWPAVQSQFDAAWRARVPALDDEAAAAAPTPPPRPLRPLRRLTSDWTLPAPDAPPIFAVVADAVERGEDVVFDWAGHTARVTGTVTHRWLQQISDDGVGQWPSARIATLASTIVDELARTGLDAQACNIACDRVLSALRNTLADERGRWLLHEHADARNELTVAAADGASVRQHVVDRTFIDEHGTRWIIDYKTSLHEGGGREEFLDREQERYRAQLDTYARLFAQIEQRTIRVGLYFPLLKAWRSWEPAP